MKLAKSPGLGVQGGAARTVGEAREVAESKLRSRGSATKEITSVGTRDLLAHRVVPTHGRPKGRGVEVHLSTGEEVVHLSA